MSFDSPAEDLWFI